MNDLVLSGQIVSGRLRVSWQRRVESWIKRAKDGPVTITIGRPRLRRSLKSNAYYWAVVIAAVSDHTGYEPDEVHELLKQMFIPKKLAVCDGNGEVKGEAVIGGSTAIMDDFDFAQYVDHIRRWAAMELGVVIPDADPSWRDAQ